MEEDKQQPVEQSVDDSKKTFYIPHDESNDKRKMVFLFLITFGVVILVFTIFLKGISPKADIDIGEDDVQYEQSDNGGFRAQIDQRLRMIQNDEDMPGVSGREMPEDIVRKYKMMNESEEQANKLREEREQEEIELESEKITEAIDAKHAAVKNSTDTSTVTKPTVTSRVYVGQFSDMQSAVDMQSDLMNSGIVHTPIIKEVNGYYTVQVGVFSNPESARKMAAQLQSAGFYASVR